MQGVFCYAFENYISESGMGFLNIWRITLRDSSSYWVNLSFCELRVKC
jgi:hypothetical protein